MGIIKLFSDCHDESHNGRVSNAREHTERMYAEPITGNPNPARFNIKKAERVGRFLVAIVHYPDCRNYEGKKILVFENVTVSTLQKLTSLDPHFCDESGHISPVARFKPTKRGWNYAVSFCNNA